jgi:prepilin-type N-terminal cleavage/methylation domain-containing protein
MKNRRGISLIEVMVAVSLLGMMATVHTVVTMRYAVRNRAAAIGVNRSTAISTAVDLFSTMPYSAVGTNTGCVTVSEPVAYPHQRCVTTTAPTSTITRVRIIIRPTNTAFRPDTLWVDRAAPPAGSLFS